MGPRLLRTTRPRQPSFDRDSIHAQARPVVAEEDGPSHPACQRNVARDSDLDAETASSWSSGRCELCVSLFSLHPTTSHFGGLTDGCPSLPDDWRHTGTGDSGAVEKFSNFFTDVRIHQIREMQEQVARTAGVPAFDFGQVWEGWQSQQQMVHPLLVSSSTCARRVFYREVDARHCLVSWRTGVCARSTTPYLDGKPRPRYMGPH